MLKAKFGLWLFNNKDFNDNGLSDRDLANWRIYQARNTVARISSSIASLYRHI